MRIRDLRPLLWPILVAAPLAGCAAGSRNNACRPLVNDSAARTSALANSPFKGTIFTIVMENHSQWDIFNSPSAPYINQLAKQYAVAGGYMDTLVHPSEPNYLWMVAGENFGVTDDNAPSSNHVDCTSHLADQIEQAGLTWHSYQESMGQPCGVDANYPYDPKHNPFVYFDDINGWDGTKFTKPARCMNNVVDYSQFAADLQSGNLPKYVFITPNLMDDMHDGTIEQGDQWLSQEVPKILASPAFQNGGVLFLTWDEGSTLGADNPPMIVISPLAKKGYLSTKSYTTSSFLKTVQAILGVEPLPCDANPAAVPTMDDLFTVPLPQVPSSAGPASSAASTTTATNSAGNSTANSATNSTANTAANSPANSAGGATANTATGP